MVGADGRGAGEHGATADFVGRAGGKPGETGDGAG